MRNIFSDKATIVIRAMLSQPERKWVVRDFEREFNVGRSMAAVILSILYKKGFIEGIRSGRLAYSKLINKKALLEDWLKFYSFDLSKIKLYYSSYKDILPRLKKYFEKKNLANNYALTLHTGANLITSYVNTRSVYCYLKNKDYDNLSLDLRQELDLKELKKGGNFYLIRPYYKESTFFECKKFKGYNAVSSLQLYLDLYNFPQRGKEHAQYLLKTLKEEGKRLV